MDDYADHRQSIRELMASFDPLPSVTPAGFGWTETERRAAAARLAGERSVDTLDQYRAPVDDGCPPANGMEST